MNLESVKNKLLAQSIYHSQNSILGKPSTIGYEKKFRLSWMGTQLNTFIVVSDFENEEVNWYTLEKHMYESFKFAEKNYTGWIRGLQSALGVISVLITDKITDDAKDYCLKLKTGKKWAGFTIPVVVDSKTGTIYCFEKNPMWGRIYFPHFKRLIYGLQ